MRAVAICICSLVLITAAARAEEAREYDVTDLPPRTEGRRLVDDTLPGLRELPEPAPPNRDGLFGGDGDDDDDDPSATREDLRPMLESISGGKVVMKRADDPDRQLALVTADPAGHARLARALERVRAQERGLISVEPRILTFDRAKLTALPEHLRDALDEAMLLGRTQRNLDAASTSELIRAHAESLPVRSGLSAPRLTLYENTEAVLVLTREHSHVKGYVTNEAGEVIPEVAALGAGLIVFTQAGMTADRQRALVAITASLSEVLELKKEPWPGATAERPLEVEAPVIDLRVTGTLGAVGQDEAILLHLRPATEAVRSDREVFLLLRASIVNPQPQPK